MFMLICIFIDDFHLSMKNILFLIARIFLLFSCDKQSAHEEVVSPEVMKQIYNEIRTPYKFGIVLKHEDSTKMVDSPTVFRHGGKWFMTYIVFDGRGYETWLAESDDMLHWETRGRILSFTEDTWDSRQKAGYVSLIDIEWGGSYEPEPFQNHFWMSYLGGGKQGYEAGKLSVGMARTDDTGLAQEWQRLEKPVLSPDDPDARWFENFTIYKSTVIHDRKKHTGYPFVMYYNAKGDTARYESIGMAVSRDLIRWKRYGKMPVISRFRKGTICGDAQITKIGDVYVMFYFGAFWHGSATATERFACSYDLIHWTEWNGPDLVAPSGPYDRKYAHKPWVVKWKGVVYHFYNAVGSEGRVIALATSKELN